MAAMVGEDKLLAVDVCGDNVPLSDDTLGGETGIMIDEGNVSPLVVGESAQGCSDEELSKGDVFMEIVPSFAPLAMTEAIAANGAIEVVRVAVR